MGNLSTLYPESSKSVRTSLAHLKRLEYILSDASVRMIRVSLYQKFSMSFENGAIPESLKLNSGISIIRVRDIGAK